MTTFDRPIPPLRHPPTRAQRYLAILQAIEATGEPLTMEEQATLREGLEDIGRYPIGRPPRPSMRIWKK